MIEIVSRTNEGVEWLWEIRCGQKESNTLNDFIKYMNKLEEFKRLKNNLANAMDMEL